MATIKTRSGEANASTATQSKATGTGFVSDKYDVSGLTYPSDLLGTASSADQNSYGGNYVIFYISVHDDSVLAKGDEKQFVDPGVTNPRIRSAWDGQEVTTLQMTEVNVATGATAGAVVQDVASSVGVNLNGKVAAGVGAGVGAIATQRLGGVNKQSKQLKKAIALYVPNDLSAHYGVDWDTDDTAGASMMFAAAEGANKIIGGALLGTMGGALLGGVSGAVLGAGAGAAGGAVAAGGTAVAGADYVTGKVLNSTSQGSAMSKQSGVATNPKKEQLFRNVTYREFRFRYEFYPRDAVEAQAVRDIIYTFKLHMHPEYKNDYHFLYIYPSEFDIYYYKDGKENLNIHRHTSCVLTDMSVSYVNQGVFTTFDDGMPTQINIDLAFKELALLTKETIMDGF